MIRNSQQFCSYSGKNATIDCSLLVERKTPNCLTMDKSCRNRL